MALLAALLLHPDLDLPDFLTQVVFASTAAETVVPDDFLKGRLDRNEVKHLLSSPHRRFLETLGKEGDPVVPFALRTNGEEPVVVLGSTSLEPR